MIFRYNEGSRQALEDLRAHCQRELPAKEGVEPTCLFSRNADVNTRNETQLGNLPGDEVTTPKFAEMSFRVHLKDCHRLHQHLVTTQD